MILWSSEYIIYEHWTNAGTLKNIFQNDYSDDFNKQFDTPNAPFLQNVPPKVKEEFERLWSNDDIPSESLRAEKVRIANRLEENHERVPNFVSALLPFN